MAGDKPRVRCLGFKITATCNRVIFTITSCARVYY